MNEPHAFPPPFPPPPFGEPGEHDVFFLRRRAERPSGEDAGTEDILMRRVPAETAALFRASAGGRSLTHAQYLVALVSLHQRLRQLAEQGDETARRELEALGLTTVSV
jgi:hypothetical protein